MNYLEHYKNSEMYRIMNDSTMKNNDNTSSTWLADFIMDYLSREQLKKQADNLSKHWLYDWALVMKDIAHWQRYLENNKERFTDFFEYIDRKYTNPELLTY